MKKSIIKKLNLTRETISDLNTDDMNQVKAGYITASCDTGCSLCTELPKLCV